MTASHDRDDTVVRWLTEEGRRIHGERSWNELADRVADGLELRRRRVRAGIAAALLTVLGLGGTFVALSGGDGNNAEVATAAPAESDLWEVIETPALPLVPRDYPAMVWVRERLVLWGGYDDSVSGEANRSNEFRTFGDGAAYDPSTGMWTVLPPAPMSATESSPVGVSADGLAVIASASELGVYDVESQTWTDYHVLAGPVRAAVWTGIEVILIGPDQAYDPATRTLRSLPGLPAALARPAAIWTGTHLVVVGIEPPTVTRSTRTRAFEFDETESTWRDVSPADSTSIGAASAWDGTNVVTVLTNDSSTRVATYAPGSGSWRDIGTIPVPSALWSPMVAHDARTLYVTTASGWLATTDMRSWATIPSPEGAPVITSIAVGDDALWLAGLPFQGSETRVFAVRREETVEPTS